jgi:hypothetical protein
MVVNVVSFELFSQQVYIENQFFFYALSPTSYFYLGGNVYVIIQAESISDSPLSGLVYHEKKIEVTH